MGTEPQEAVWLWERGQCSRPGPGHIGWCGWSAGNWGTVVRGRGEPMTAGAEGGGPCRALLALARSLDPFCVGKERTEGYKQRSDRISFMFEKCYIKEIGPREGSPKITEKGAGRLEEQSLQRPGGEENLGQ